MATTLSSRCGFDYQCNLVKSLAYALCITYQRGKICDTINTVIGQKYDRHRRLSGIVQEGNAWYLKHRRDKKYFPEKEDKKKTKLDLRQRDFEVFMNNKLKEYNAPTPEEISLENAVRKNAGKLKELIEAIKNNGDIQTMVTRINSMKEQKEGGIFSAIKDLGPKIMALAKTLFEGCLENLGSCLSIIAVVASALVGLVCFFIPPCGWVATLITRSSTAYRLVKSFTQALFGWKSVYIESEQYKERVPTNQKLLTEQMKEEENARHGSWIQRTWMSFADWSKKNSEQKEGGILVAPQRDKKFIKDKDGNWIDANWVGTKEITKYRDVKKISSFIDTVLLFATGIEPILGETKSLRLVIKTAYLISYATAVGTVGKDLLSCVTGNTKACVSAGLRSVGFALSLWVNSYLDQTFSKSEILALQMEGIFLSELFWFAAQQAAHHNLFPSMLGNDPYQQLRSVSYARTAVSFVNLFYSAQQLVPIYASDKLNDLQTMALISLQLMDRKVVNVMSSYQGNWLGLNLDEQKQKYEEKISEIRETVERLETKEAQRIKCLVMLEQQQKVLDIGNKDIIQEKVKGFHQISSQFQVGYCRSYVVSFADASECLQFNNENLKDMTDKGRLARILLYVDNYIILYESLLKIARDGMRVDKEIAEKMRDMDNKIYKRVEELRRWKKEITPDKLGQPFENLFDFVKRDVQVRKDITSGDKVFIDPDEDTIKKVEELRRKTSNLIKQKIATLHDQVSLDMVDKVLNTIEQNEPPSAATSLADQSNYKLKF